MADPELELREWGGGGAEAAWICLKSPRSATIKACRTFGLLLVIKSFRLACALVCKMENS